jgi:hypothetical protein
VVFAGPFTVARHIGLLGDSPAGTPLNFPKHKGVVFGSKCLRWVPTGTRWITSVASTVGRAWNAGLLRCCCVSEHFLCPMLCAPTHDLQLHNGAVDPSHCGLHPACVLRSFDVLPRIHDLLDTEPFTPGPSLQGSIAGSSRQLEGLQRRPCSAKWCLLRPQVTMAVARGHELPSLAQIQEVRGRIVKDL